MTSHSARDVRIPRVLSDCTCSLVHLRKLPGWQKYVGAYQCYQGCLILWIFQLNFWSVFWSAGPILKHNLKQTRMLFFPIPLCLGLLLFPTISGGTSFSLFSTQNQVITLWYQSLQFSCFDRSPAQTELGVWGRTSRKVLQTLTVLN